MTYGEVLSLGRDAILVAFYATGPVLILGMVTGLMVVADRCRSVTQIQEPTLTFIPKILASGFALLFGWTARLGRVDRLHEPGLTFFCNCGCSVK